MNLPRNGGPFRPHGRFPRRHAARRPSKLDAFKPLIVRWLDRHPYSAAQLFRQAEAGEGRVAASLAAAA